MNETITSPAGQGNVTSRRGTRVLLAVPVIGAVATAASGIAAIVVTAVGGALITPYGASPQEPVYAYGNAHYTDVYLTSHPLLLAACCALIVAATALATYRRKAAAAVLLCAAAAMPWIPAMAFLHHLWQLAPAS